MKPFDVLANIVAGFFVWIALTALICFFVIWGNDAAPGRTPWLWIAAILVVSGLSFWRYTIGYWKKLDR